MKQIKVLYATCRKCDEFVKRLKEAAGAIGLEYELEIVDDMRQIISYGVMMTPGLVVDGELKMAGKLPSVAEIKKMIQ